MSLYGLDVIIAKDGRMFLNEINGIRSGMGGFQQVYGDNRVEEEVFDMLQTKYGNLTVNDGTYRRNKFRKECPFKYALSYVLSKIPLAKRVLLPTSPTLLSKKAEIQWLSDQAINSTPIELPFDSYDGQESTIINILNEELPHPTINPIISEAISGNKFLQYLLLSNSDISETIIKSSLVGLGATSEGELEGMLFKNDAFVVKPILGSCGRGVQVLTKDEIDKKYSHSRGPIDYINPLDAFLSVKKSSKIKYIEDLVEQNDYSFELGISIIQPFIDSKQKGVYSAIRAIICNGKFVDAYQRISSNQKVNLSQDATAISFDYEGDFVRFCEKTVKVFEEKSNEHPMDSYKKTLYQKYMNERGKTSNIQRGIDKISPLISMMSSMAINKVGK